MHDNANREAFRDIAKSSNIIHLATHGVADTNKPLDSFVVLADSKYSSGILTARDITWSLPCELVTLSACQTALGKQSGEGIIGLSRAFLVAGTRSVLVSLWNISDKATADFMVLFYEYYIKYENKSIALQKASEEIYSHSNYDHLIYWSAFTLVGSDY